jgi:hypothetical protein
VSAQERPRDERLRLGRRETLRLGGIGLSLAAIAAACGEDRGGDSDPGRVGYVPPETALPDYPIDDAVLLRTSASVEATVIASYEEMLASGQLPDDVSQVMDELLTRHEALLEVLGTLTEQAGGEPWTCTNPWFDVRLIAPMMVTVADSDDPPRDMLRVAVSLEDWAAGTHQQFTAMIDDPELRVGTASGASIDARNSATLVVLTGDPEQYVSPTIDGGEPAVVDGLPLQYAIPTRFGSVAQFELIIGAPDENGTRTTYQFQTPAENSYIYNELEPTC